VALDPLQQVLREPLANRRLADLQPLSLGADDLRLPGLGREDDLVGTEDVNLLRLEIARYFSLWSSGRSAI
jgi:hypothetical protein